MAFLGNDYDGMLKECKFTCYCSFASKQEFIGIEWIRKLYEINRDHELGLFECFVRYSDKSSDESLPTISGRFLLSEPLIDRFNGDFVASRVAKESWEKIYICGPPVMNHVLINELEKKEVKNEKVIII